MNQKLEFIEKAGARGANISALCREYGISRQTGHKWLRRFRAQGKHRPHRAEPPAAHKPAHDCRGGHRKHPRAARATLEPQSFRFTPEQAATIKEEAKRLGSTTAFVRELIDDYRTMFGLPNIQVEVLQADITVWIALQLEGDKAFAPATTIGSPAYLRYPLRELDRRSTVCQSSPEPPSCTTLSTGEEITDEQNQQANSDYRDV